MDLKVGAQHAALASQLIHLGYERLMNDGTDFVTALMRSTGSTSGSPNDVRQRARNFYNGQVFGAPESRRTRSRTCSPPRSGASRTTSAAPSKRS